MARRLPSLVIANAGWSMELAVIVELDIFLLYWHIYLRGSFVLIAVFENSFVYPQGALVKNSFPFLSCIYFFFPEHLYQISFQSQKYNQSSENLLRSTLTSSHSYQSVSL